MGWLALRSRRSATVASHLSIQRSTEGSRVGSLPVRGWGERDRPLGRESISAPSAGSASLFRVSAAFAAASPGGRSLCSVHGTHLRLRSRAEPRLPRSVQILQAGGLLNALGTGLILP